MKTYTLKNQHGKFIYGREYTNAIISMLHNKQEETFVGGRRITVLQKFEDDGVCEVKLNIEGI